jgi:hypothetical protein
MAVCGDRLLLYPCILLKIHRFHLACAARFAIIFRLRSDSFAARALPPLDAPSFDSATAAGFLVSGFSTGLTSGVPSIFSPIRSSMTERASRFGSRGRLGLLAREGIILVYYCFLSFTRKGSNGPSPQLGNAATTHKVG